MSASVESSAWSAGKLRYLFITAVVLAVDQLTKYWAVTRLRAEGVREIVPGFLNFNYTENAGIAFGMLGEGNLRWLLVAVSFIATTVVVFYIMRTPAANRLLLWALALLAAGITGNLIDRLRLGRVIDFIEVYYGAYSWPVFNVADTAISVGAALMAIELFITPAPAKATAEDRAESVQE